MATPTQYNAQLTRLSNELYSKGIYFETIIDPDNMYNIRGNKINNTVQNGVLIDNDIPYAFYIMNDSEYIKVVTFTDYMAIHNIQSIDADSAVRELDTKYPTRKFRIDIKRVEGITNWQYYYYQEFLRVLPNGHATYYFFTYKNPDNTIGGHAVVIMRIGTKLTILDPHRLHMPRYFGNMGSDYFDYFRNINVYEFGVMLYEIRRPPQPVVQTGPRLTPIPNNIYKKILDSTLMMNNIFTAYGRQISATYDAQGPVGNCVPYAFYIMGNTTYDIASHVTRCMRTSGRHGITYDQIVLELNTKYPHREFSVVSTMVEGLQNWEIFLYNEFMTRLENNEITYFIYRYRTASGIDSGHAMTVARLNDILYIIDPQRSHVELGYEGVMTIRLDDFFNEQRRNGTTIYLVSLIVVNNRVDENIIMQGRNANRMIINSAANLGGGGRVKRRSTRKNRTSAAVAKRTRVWSKK